MNPDDPRVYQGGMFPVVTVEADRPNRLLFGRVRDAIKRWQEQNLYNQEYSGASDYIGAGLGMIGSEAARALANVASLGEYAVREIIPSGITGRPARRYSAYESNPASYAIAEAAMDFAPVPMVDDAIRAARRTATRRAARNVSDQIVRGSADVSAAREQAAGAFGEFRPSLRDSDRDVFSMAGTMDYDQRQGFLRDIMMESGENWRQYYRENPQRKDQIIELYKGIGATESDAKYLANSQIIKQQYPMPNLMIHDYPMYSSKQLHENTFLPRLEAYLSDLVDSERMTADHAENIMAFRMGQDYGARSPGVLGAYNRSSDYGWSYPLRDTITHEAAHALQGDIGRDMVDLGVGRTQLPEYERDIYSAMSRAERVAQDQIDASGNNNPNLFSSVAYDQAVKEMIENGRTRFRMSLPWDWTSKRNLVYNWMRANKNKARKRMGVSEYMYERFLDDAKKMHGASDYLKDPAEIQARVSGEFAEKVLADKAYNYFLEDIDPYNLPEYSELSESQRNYMFKNFFGDTTEDAIVPIAYDLPEGKIDMQDVTISRRPLGDEILSGFYDMKLFSQQDNNASIPSGFSYRDVFSDEALWEMFRNVTRSVPAVAAGTTAAGYGVSLGSDQ